ncbi:MAG: XRE family transcriptional regulator [Arthrobacter sp.]|jgi:transcriptional regulator with XRE-family HTH domain|nr:XRE family transcriptional regulator [Arthrobacter sp.]
MPEVSPAERTRLAIAVQVKAKRAALGLSARALADAAGVSPALVSQLENAQANPTIEVLAAVSQALGTTLADLARIPAAGPVVTRAPEKGSPEDLEGRTLLPAAGARRVEMYEMFLPAWAQQQSAPHGVGSEEVAYVVTGSVEVSTDEWSVSLKAGDGVRFPTESEHAYRAGKRGVRLVTAVSMPSA